MEAKMEEILKRLEIIESIQYAMINASDISKLPDELQDQIRIKKQTKERIYEINLMNEWIEKDKRDIIAHYYNKPLTKREKEEAINRYCNIGSERWWSGIKTNLRATRGSTARDNKRQKKNDAINTREREKIIMKEKHEERDPEIRKERENEIRINELFE